MFVCIYIGVSLYVYIVVWCDPIKNNKKEKKRSTDVRMCVYKWKPQHLLQDQTRDGRYYKLQIYLLGTV